MNAQRWMSQQFFLFFIGWGVFLPYWTGWLVAQKGLTVAEASVIMSIGLVARGLSTLLIFPSISRKWNAKKVIVFYAGASLLFALCYFVTAGFWATLVVTALFSFSYPSLMPALESAAGILVQRTGLHYGRARSYGSIGFVCMVFLLTFAVSMVGEQAILWLMLFCIAAFCVGLTLLTPAEITEQPTEGVQRSSFRNVLQTKGFFLVLLIVICIQGAHATYYNNGYLYLQHLNVPAYSIGIVINIAVLFEIGILLYADRWFRHWHPVKLLMIASIGATVRWLIVYLFPSMSMFIVSQSLHALSFALAHYAFILYITQHLQKAQIPTAQGLYSAFALSWSTAILTVLAGSLYELEPRLAFLAMALFTIFAFLGTCLYLQREKRARKESYVENT